MLLWGLVFLCIKRASNHYLWKVSLTGGSVDRDFADGERSSSPHRASAERGGGGVERKKGPRRNWLRVKWPREGWGEGLDWFPDEKCKKKKKKKKKKKTYSWAPTGPHYPWAPGPDHPDDVPVFLFFFFLAGPLPFFHAKRKGNRRGLHAS